MYEPSMTSARSDIAMSGASLRGSMKLKMAFGVPSAG
jgi:hypothetical protein